MGRGVNAVWQGQYLGRQGRKREILPNLLDFTRIKTGLDTQKVAENWEGAEMEIVAKALDGQRYLLPQCEYMLCDSERGNGPKGADDLCSGIFEDLGLKVSINNGV